MLININNKNFNKVAENKPALFLCHPGNYSLRIVLARINNPANLYQTPQIDHKPGLRQKPAPGPFLQHKWTRVQKEVFGTDKRDRNKNSFEDLGSRYINW